jgi:Beta-ketoacyl synthase, C-terminal domain
VAFVSIHGTGTPLGDPIEAGALGQALGSGGGSRKQQPGRSVGRPLAAVSSKACYDHTEGTAGLTGLLLALQVSRAHQEKRGPVDQIRVRLSNQLVKPPILLHDVLTCNQVCNRRPCYMRQRGLLHPGAHLSLCDKTAWAAVSCQFSVLRVVFCALGHLGADPIGKIFLADMLVSSDQHGCEADSLLGPFDEVQSSAWQLVSLFFR